MVSNINRFAKLQLTCNLQWWWWCYPTPFEGWGRGEFPGDRTVGPRPKTKVWTKGQKWKK